MTQDEDSNDDRKPIPGSIPSSVRKAGAEARIAEKKASDEWVRADDVIEQLEALRNASELEREMAKDDGYTEDALYHHGKVVTAQSAIDIVERTVNADADHRSESSK